MICLDIGCIMKEVEPVPIAGNRLVWKHIQEENALAEKIPNLSEGLNEEELKMILDPLGYDAIKDIDEINLRHRRKTDDPYIQAAIIDRERKKKADVEEKLITKWENEDYKRWKSNSAERR